MLLAAHMMIDSLNWSPNKQKLCKQVNKIIIIIIVIIFSVTDQRWKSNVKLSLRTLVSIPRVCVCVHLF